MYCGGLHHANALVKEGLVKEHRFRLFSGYLGWDAGQLQAELLEGRWWVLAASAPLVISFLHGGPLWPAKLRAGRCLVTHAAMVSPVQVHGSAVAA